MDRWGKPHPTLRQTNPIRPGPASAEDEICKTNPISVAGGRSRARTPNPRSGRGQAPRRETCAPNKANSRQAGRCPRGRLCKTNPIPGVAASGRRRTKSAKRTQLPEARHRGGVGESAGGWNAQYSNILLFHHSVPMPMGKTIGKLRGLRLPLPSVAFGDAVNPPGGRLLRCARNDMGGGVIGSVRVRPAPTLPRLVGWCGCTYNARWADI